MLAHLNKGEGNPAKPYLEFFQLDKPAGKGAS